MAGDHSDVGGHIDNNRVLARHSLRKMIEQARLVDVPVANWGLITDAELKAPATTTLPGQREES